MTHPETSFITRRSFLKRAMAGLVSGLLIPLWAHAAWPRKLFEMTQLDAALKEVTAGKKIQDSAIELTVPGIAENGGQVRVEVKTAVENVQKIFLLVEKNPVPLVCEFQMPQGALADFSVNVKVRETSRVIALVETPQQFYRAQKEVSVTAGGCG